MRVDGRTVFACVDGPEFDGHAVDFAVLADLLTTYRPFEAAAVERREACKVPRLAHEANLEAAGAVR